MGIQSYLKLGDDGDTVMWRDPVLPSEKVLGLLEIVKEPVLCKSLGKTLRQNYSKVILRESARH